MAKFTLPLRKVRCMNCANKIHTALTALPGISKASIDTKNAVIEGDIDPIAAINIIDQLGYEAGYKYDLPLRGLSCGKCVNKVKTALAESPGMIDYQVSKTRLSGLGTVPTASIITQIEALGFQVPDLSTSTLTLSGLSCGKCVAKVEQALTEHPDVESFDVSKTSATIASYTNQQSLIELITNLGLTAVDANHHGMTKNAESQVSSTPPQQKKECKEQSQKESEQGNKANQFILSGMTCASCVASVEKAIVSVKGVASASVNLAERTALVTGSASTDVVIQAISDAGYGAELSEDEQSRRQRQQQQNEVTFRKHIRNAYIALGAGGPMMAWGMLGGSMMINSPQDQVGWGAVGILTLALLLTVGRHFFINAWKAFKHHRATMDTLVALGTGAAWLYSMLVVIAPELLPIQARHVYFEASAMILGLVTLGHALEARARSRTSKALEQLMDLQPQTAVIIEHGQEREVPLAEVKAGMLLRLYPGAKVPVDGTIVDGNSYIDESMLTGEPIPANKQQGDLLHAGTINQNGSLIFKAEKIGHDTMLARIISLVRQAQSSKPELARLADTISSIFVPSVMIIAIITAVVWYYVGPDPSSVYMLVAATTVLIIACPCALGLATPMSVTVGVGRAAEYGVLIRNAEAMQIAADVDTVVLDKTGTLTEGRPQLVELKTYHGIDHDELLTLSASLEQGSEHPLAKAVLEAAKDKSLELQPLQTFKANPGYGVSGMVDGHQILLGNSKLMELHQINITAELSDADAISQQGATPIFIAKDNQLIGIMGISDPLRHDSVDAIKRLKSMNLEVIMLTGDVEATAKAIAIQAGIDHVIAGVLPDGKAAEISALQQQGKKVAMVGDGINDAPALAQAEVGIAMGSGSDVAIESAQLTLVRHSLHGVADALQLSEATLKNMKQNLFGAFIYNTLGIPIAAGVLFPFTGALLSPVVAGAAMALSSITVVSNANRLRLFRPKGSTHRTSPTAKEQ
ncbi:copper-translocating P-type ATPase [Photobacterium minamisatsumaniensis]|uniref:copper-translocating P-type ATPase n=1 Tax=Photobacterium minamisatsumaniensis TaxID=2910233 RepID=UPI003D0ED31F